jgi:sugar phosphate isomerase/epimerase
MEYALSTYLFVNERLSSHVLDRVLAAGISQFELFAARQHLNYGDPNQVRDLGLWFTDHGIKLHSLHAPVYSEPEGGRAGSPPLSIAYLEKRLRIASMDEIKRALEAAEHLPFRYLVLHMGLDDESWDLGKFDAAFTSIEHLSIFAKDYGVQILLENIPNDLTAPERLVQFIHYTRMESLKICFDVGHAHLTASVASAFHTLKDRIASVHLHDNHGEKDEHLLPFEGTIDWPSAVRDFRAAATQFPLVFELRGEGPEPFNVARLGAVIEKLEAIQ